MKNSQTSKMPAIGIALGTLFTTACVSNELNRAYLDGGPIGYLLLALIIVTIGMTTGFAARTLTQEAQHTLTIWFEKGALNALPCFFVYQTIYDLVTHYTSFRYLTPPLIVMTAVSLLISLLVSYMMKHQVAQFRELDR